MIPDANLLDYLQVLLLTMIVAYFAMKEVGDDREVNPILEFIFTIFFMLVAAVFAIVVVIAVFAALFFGVIWVLDLIDH